MKNLNKLASVCLLALLGVLTLTGCEGADLYKVGSPSWLNDAIDSIADSKKTTIVNVTPNPTELGTPDKSAAFWSAFTDDVKVEPGTSAQVKFINYGGGANYNNFVIVLRNATKDFEYGVLRADNFSWGTDYPYPGDDRNFFMELKIEEGRDWPSWLTSMSMAKCTATISNPGDGTASVQIIMTGSDGSTYSQEYNNIVGINKDDLYFAFTVDHSYIEFGDIDIVDSEPVSMTLNGISKKILLETVQTTELDEIFKNVKATVTFESGATKEVEVKDLIFKTIPDIASIGKKTLVAVYNKTLLDKGSETPIIASEEFEVVEKMYTCVGATDNTGDFASEHSEAIKVGKGETFITTFTNYSLGETVWQNFVVELFNQAKTQWYATLRADNYGWGDGYGACTHKTTQPADPADPAWQTWLKAMNGAKVTVYVTNNGDGTADVKAVMIGNDGKEYTQAYNGINTIDPENLYFHLTVDHSHIEFDNVVGAEDNSGEFGSARSAVYKIPSGATYVTRIKNHTLGETVWQNFVVELWNQSTNQYHATLRADNYGWGDGYAACTHETTQPADPADPAWQTWLKAMNDAYVTVYVTNNGDGTANVKAVMKGNDGKEYTQAYNGINTIDPENLYFHYTIDHCHLVFE